MKKLKSNSVTLIAEWRGQKLEMEKPENVDVETMKRMMMYKLINQVLLNKYEDEIIFTQK